MLLLNPTRHVGVHVEFFGCAAAASRVNLYICFVVIAFSVFSCVLLFCTVFCRSCSFVVLYGFVA